jgi:hypothetical protein
MVGDRSDVLRRSEVYGVFRCVEECHDTSDARRADVGVHEGINKGALDELFQEAFTAQLALFRTMIQDIVAEAIRPLREASIIQDIVAEAIRPLREASIDVGFGGYFGPCSPVLRISSPSSMAASIAASRAACEDKGGLSIGVRSEKM